MRRTRVVIVVLVLAIAAAVTAERWLPVRARRLISSTALPDESNILPGDYVGPETCRECHEENYDLWSKHSHSRMNQDASAATVRGDFSGVRVALDDGHVVFAREGEDHVMTLERGGAVVRRYRVTRTVGGRFTQMYVGLQTVGPEPPDHVVYSQEQKLPFGYWFKLKRWLPTSYFDPPGAESAQDGTLAYDPFDRPRVHLWEQNCMLCHNTYAYAYRLLKGSPARAGFPQGDLHVAPALFSAVSPLTSDIAFGAGDLVTLGISCESCHFGGRAHATEDHPPRFLPTSPHVAFAPQKPGTSIAPERKNPYAVNGICAQCHSATVSLFPNGCGTWNSREALDMRAGACDGAIRCTDCHDPHVASGPEAGPDLPKHVEACAGCHAKQRAPEHSRHAPGTTSCLDCHMPRITQGLEEVVRTHHISSPTDARMLSQGLPNACNLCHLDRSISWTVAELRKGWGTTLAADDDWAEKYGGSLDAPVGGAWLASEASGVRLVAAQAYARSPLAAAHLDQLVAALDDPVPVNRVFATFAVQRVTGLRVEPALFDVTAAPDVRARQLEAVRAKLRSPR